MKTTYAAIHFLAAACRFLSATCGNASRTCRRTDMHKESPSRRGAFFARDTCRRHVRKQKIHQTAADGFAELVQAVQRATPLRSAVVDFVSLAGRALGSARRSRAACIKTSARLTATHLTRTYFCGRFCTKTSARHSAKRENSFNALGFC